MQDDEDNEIVPPLPDPDSVVVRIRKFVISIRSSPQKTQLFESHVSLSNIQPKTLSVVLNVDTRWNSTFAMLGRAKTLRVPLTTFMASEKTSELGNEDWAQLDSLLLLLQPLNDITKHLSTSKFPSISTVMPAYVALIKQTQVVVKSNPSLRHAQSAIESKLEFYYHAALKKPIDTAATILDPRLKHSYFKGKNDSASIKKQFLKDSEPFSKYSSKQAATTSSSQMPQRTWINYIFKKSKTSSIE